jgi:predicted TIM-barrel fold metal-dependent hydrolase
MEHPVLAAWHTASRALLPPAVAVWDAHTHTGDTDPDGFTNTPAESIAHLDRAGHAGAVIITSADSVGYADHNDRVLAEAAASEGRLVPFLRVDPTRAGSLDEVARCLDAGHRGIKMHPRSESFPLSDPGVAPIAGLAAERRVPILIHAGRGMDPLGSTPLDLIDAYPGLQIILAHCGVSDLATLAPGSRTRPGLQFDTAWWNPTDLAALFAWVDASQILYASDMPYGSPLMSATISVRAAVQAGLSGPALSAVFGGNLLRDLKGDDPLPIGSGVAAYPDPGLLRIASNLFGAIDTTFSGGNHLQAFELARRATETAPSPYSDLLAAIAATLDAVAELDPGATRQRIGLLVVACSAALTPLAGHPNL